LHLLKLLFLTKLRQVPVLSKENPLALASGEHSSLENPSGGLPSLADDDDDKSIGKNSSSTSAELKKKTFLQQDNQVVVIDNLSGKFKAGFAGDEAPGCVFPNIVGRPKHLGVMHGMASKSIYVGHEAAKKKRSSYFTVSHGTWKCRRLGGHGKSLGTYL